MKMDDHGREVRVSRVIKALEQPDGTFEWLDYEVYYTAEMDCDVCSPDGVDTDPHAGVLCFTLSFHPSVSDEKAMDAVNAHHWTP